MKFLKSLGLLLLIVSFWCDSVLGFLYLIERHRIQESDLLGSLEQSSKQVLLLLFSAMTTEQP